MNYCITITHIILYINYITEWLICSRWTTFYLCRFNLHLYYRMADLFTLNDLLFMSLQPSCWGAKRIKNAPGIHTEVSDLDQLCRWICNGNQWRGSYVQPGPNPCHEILVLTPWYICISKKKKFNMKYQVGVLIVSDANRTYKLQWMTGWPQLPGHARSKELPPQCWR